MKQYFTREVTSDNEPFKQGGPARVPCPLSCNVIRQAIIRRIGDCSEVIAGFLLWGDFYGYNLQFPPFSFWHMLYHSCLYRYDMLKMFPIVNNKNNTIQKTMYLREFILERQRLWNERFLWRKRSKLLFYSSTNPFRDKNLSHFNAVSTQFWNIFNRKSQCIHVFRLLS